MTPAIALSQLNRAVVEHVTYALRNSVIRTYPFPHFYATDVFPADFYADFVAALPTDDAYAANEDGKYANRVFADPLSLPGLAGFRTKEFTLSVLRGVFGPWCDAAFPDGKLSIATDLRLIRDTEGYAIGPHTDAAWKLISLLFYLPPPGTAPAAHGTSVYIPQDPDFRCAGGPHHKFENFVRVWTAPFAPNSCVGFWKTDAAFHGVERITYPVRRDVLLWNAYNAAIPKKP